MPPIHAPPTARTASEDAVLQALWTLTTATRADLVVETGLTHPTVSAALDRLTASGWIEPCGIGSSTGGRRPHLFRFNPEAALLIGLDVGGTKIAGGLLTLDGRPIARNVLRTAVGPADPFERICQVIDLLIAEIPAGKPLLGIGLGLPGVTNRSRGTVTLAPALGWRHFPLGPLLADRYGVTIQLENDVNAILLGERWRGAARTARHALCVAIGTGIGAALLMDGRLYRGASEAAGEIGYTVTDRSVLDSLPPSPDGFGFLESLTAGPGIARRGSEALGRPVTTAEVFAAATTEPAAAQVLDESAAHLAIALANAVVLLNPELVLLSGGVMNSSGLLERLRPLLQRLVPTPPVIEHASLGELAGILGAASLLLGGDGDRLPPAAEVRP